MAYIVAEPCIKCKYTDCVLVCPVDCFHEIDNMLVINPDECIDCGACEPECPTTAIFEESELPDKWSHFIEINATRSQDAPVINEQKEPFPGADDHVDEEDKFSKYGV